MRVFPRKTNVRAVPVHIGAIVFLSILGAALVNRYQVLHAVAERPINVDRLLASFVGKRSPESKVDLNEWLETPASRELVDPSNSLPTSFRYSRSEIGQLVTYTESCGAAPFLRDPRLQKALTWAEFRCHLEAVPSRANGRIATTAVESTTDGLPKAVLPPHFFTVPPFMHPSGHSFVWLALQAHADFATPSWLASNARYLHVTEFSSVRGLPKRYEPLKTLSPALLRAAIEGKPIAVGNHLVVIPTESTALFFQKSVLEKFLTENDIILVAAHAKCLAAIGAYCLEPDTARRAIRWSRYLAFIWITASLLFGVILSLIYHVRKQKRVHAEARALMLKTLTHELRTPATSLRFAVETLRKYFDSFPSEVQGSFFQICEDVHRLGRLISASTQYLRSQEDSSVFKFNIQNVSVNELVADVIEAFEGVEFTQSVSDYRIETDPYWIRTCLLNLLENAVRHGKRPIRGESL